MKSIVDQLSTYKSVHLNKKNVRTHFFGVPLIVMSVMVLVNMLNIEWSSQTNEVVLPVMPIVALLVVIYYVILDLKIGLIATLLFAPVYWAAVNISVLPNAAWMAVGIFVIGWIIQFVGHAYEKAKPAFVDDLNQLLIGPLFLVSEVVFALGINEEMEKEVTEIARDKRRAFEKAKSA
ncbi:Mpo1 family 2-hydroxy fatty acid dioxygenase [Thalassotalea eurytherma]|uniref:DUF962 domain-containing protein n=1 Tax=Thalassotalea eurytherma TaxID=1144278 RepID=A0ABQ6H477_9GAMM|nr:Mpo1-like protein [Thalassotalea eurytherma]GLX81950.1 hypothetical protein theurythT_14020 [Thalassotalea eurytherma]